MSKIWIDLSGRWSGGGAVVNNNFSDFIERYPDLLSDSKPLLGGVQIVQKNQVSLSNFVSGDYLILPQNAWAWIGKSSSDPYWILKRMAFRIFGDLGVARSKGVIRLSSSIPAYGKKNIVLPNVLDQDFDTLIENVKQNRERRVVYSFGASIGYRDYKTLVSGFLKSNVSLSHKLIIRANCISKIDHYLLTRQVYKHSNIEIRSGSIPRDQLHREISNSDLVVFPSSAEASPISFLEVIAYRKPYLVSDIPGFVQSIYNKQDLSRVFLTGNADSLSECLNNSSNWRKPSPDLSSTVKGREQLRENWFRELRDYLENVL